MIGVIGGYGSIGQGVVKCLNQWGYSELKVGGRTPEKVSGEFTRLYPRVKLEKVDFENSKSLTGFIGGCNLLINCSGPSYKTAYNIAVASMELGVDYVDVGMDKRMERLKGRFPKNVLVYNSGTSQGFSGILQRVLLDDFDDPETLEYSFGGISPYSVTGAEDFIQGLVNNENKYMVSWDNGGIVGNGMSEVETDGFFDKTAEFYPFFDEESEYITSNYPLSKGIWNFVVEGRHFKAVLRRARFSFQSNPQKTVQDIYEASIKDAEEFYKQIKFYLKVKGMKGGENIEKVISLRTEEQHVLSGAVTAATAISLMKGGIRCGVHNLIEIDNPQGLYRRISKVDGVYILEDSHVINNMDEGFI